MCGLSLELWSTSSQDAGNTRMMNALPFIGYLGHTLTFQCSRIVAEEDMGRV